MIVLPMKARVIEYDRSMCCFYEYHADKRQKQTIEGNRIELGRDKRKQVISVSVLLILSLI